MSNIAKATIAIIILLLLWGGTVYFRRAPIEQDLTAQVKAALNRPEFSDVAVSFDGRKGTLTGSVASEELKAEAEKRAGEYWGVRTIGNQLQVLSASSSEAPAQQMAAVSGFQFGDKFLLTGMVPDESTRTRLFQQAETVFGAGNVTDRLGIRSGLRMAEGFDTDYARFLRTDRIKSVGFAIENDAFTLKNTVPAELSGFRPTEVSTSNTASAQEKVGVKVAAIDTKKAAASTDLQQKLDELLEMNRIEFATSSALLSESSQKTLDRVVALLNQFPQSRVEIQGHTDTIGGSASNMQLSDARAQAVYRYLTSKGVAAERLVANGYGDQRPIADNNSFEGRQRNRRVAFRLQ